MFEEFEREQDGVEPDDDAGVADDATAPVDDDATAGQPPKRQPKPKVNLDDIEEFRQVKSTYDRMVTEANQRAQYAQQQYLQTQQRLEQLETKDLDDFETLKYKLDKSYRDQQALKQQYDYLQAEVIRDRTVNQIAQKLGVPVEVLDLTDPTSAYRSAAEYLATQGSQRQAPQQDEDEDDEPSPGRLPENRVALGGGEPRSSAVRYKARMQKAIKENNPLELLRLQDEAHDRGIEVPGF